MFWDAFLGFIWWSGRDSGVLLAHQAIGDFGYDAGAQCETMDDWWLTSCGLWLIRCSDPGASGCVGCAASVGVSLHSGCAPWFVLRKKVRKAYVVRPNY